jgi:cell filamentation protein
VFDPFGDFASEGYLRNKMKLKVLGEIKVLEHTFFEAHIEEALAYLRRIHGDIGYKHFLEVQRILFGEFYPWAGKDRQTLGVARLVTKGANLQFEASELCQQAVQWGLDMGNDKQKMRSQPGKVMGQFAWGHPFLDGNGRTMLLVHSELCHRAGFSINWPATSKSTYLQALTKELDNPAAGHLDIYLQPFVESAASKGPLLEMLKALPGLDGSGEIDDQNVSYADDDALANQRYLDVKRAREEK